jgi:hypothetical protein
MSTRTVKKYLGREVIDSFFRKEYDEGYNYGEHNSNIFFEGDKLYSYGYHFVMAQRLYDEQGEFYLINADSYSRTTAKHQSYVRTEAQYKRHILIPFSALEGARIIKDTIKMIDKESDKEVPYMGTNWQTGEKELMHRHLMGSSLIKATREEKVFYQAENGYHTYRWDSVEGYFLCGLDETAKDMWNSFFLVELDVTTNFQDNLVEPSVENAYHSLKPKQVIIAESLGREVVRQGEWFFVAVDDEASMGFLKQMEKTKSELVQKNVMIPNREEDRVARHKATRFLKTDEYMFAKGTIRHPEHKMVKLDTWHRVYENVQIKSWTASGKID